MTEYYKTPFRKFVLERDEDETGVSGTGVVAEGVLFSNGVVALQWTSQFPTSVVFHHKGMGSVHAVHGHGGKTRIMFLDPSRPDEGPRWQSCPRCRGIGRAPVSPEDTAVEMEKCWMCEGQGEFEER